MKGWAFLLGPLLDTAEAEQQRVSTWGHTGSRATTQPCPRRGTASTRRRGSPARSLFASPLGARQGLQVGWGLLLNVAAGLLLDLPQSLHERGAGVRGRVGPGAIAGGQDHATGLRLCGLRQRHLGSVHGVALGHGLQGGEGEVSVPGTWGTAPREALSDTHCAQRLLGLRVAGGLFGQQGVWPKKPKREPANVSL